MTEQKKAKVHCTGCGNATLSTASFCPNCGARISVGKIQLEIEGNNADEVASVAKELIREAAKLEASLNDAQTEHEHLEQALLGGWQRKLVAYFDVSEIKDLCLDLGVDYEELPGVKKSDMSRELILFLERRGRLDQLTRLCRRSRPNVDWESTGN